LEGRHRKHKAPRNGGRAHANVAVAGNIGGLSSLKIPSLMKEEPQRLSHQEPERFQQFDQRFVFDHMKRGTVDFRQELDDDERRRFIPDIMRARGIDIPLIEYIFGLNFNEEISEECVAQPTEPGIWEMTTNGCWVPVSMADEKLISDISHLRGDRQQPIIISG
jgi:hypothetical protein